MLVHATTGARAMSSTAAMSVSARAAVAPTPAALRRAARAPAARPIRAATTTTRAALADLPADNKATKVLVVGRAADRPNDATHLVGAPPHPIMVSVSCAHLPGPPPPRLIATLSMKRRVCSGTWPRSIGTRGASGQAGVPGSGEEEAANVLYGLHRYTRR